MSSIESVMHEIRVFTPSETLQKNAAVKGMDGYKALCKKASDDYESFWAELARELLDWKKPFTETLDESNAPFYRWFGDGELNVSYNCLDRHLATRGNQTAIIFEADDGTVSHVTYQELYHRVCKLANGLKTLKLNTGDRVIIYLPMGVEAVVAMQACARLGLTHSVVFGGFSSKSLQERIQDTSARAVITADGQFRGGKALPLKTAVDEALAMPSCETVETVIVYKRTGIAIELNKNDIS
jgi:acetyl-CoA synthetase